MNAVHLPWQRLTADQLRHVAEAFILREGTDYGMIEKSHDAKIAALLKQIKSGHVLITFDPKLESFNLIPKECWMED